MDEEGRGVGAGALECEPVAPGQLAAALDPLPAVLEEDDVDVLDELDDELAVPDVPPDPLVDDAAERLSVR